MGFVKNNSGDWEDILPTEKLPYICSTPAGGDPKWTSQGGPLPNDYKLNCPRDYQPYHSVTFLQIEMVAINAFKLTKTDKSLL